VTRRTLTPTAKTTPRMLSGTCSSNSAPCHSSRLCRWPSPPSSHRSQSPRWHLRRPAPQRRAQLRQRLGRRRRIAADWHRDHPHLEAGRPAHRHHTRQRVGRSEGPATVRRSPHLQLLTASSLSTRRNVRSCRDQCVDRADVYRARRDRPPGDGPVVEARADSGAGIVSPINMMARVRWRNSGLQRPCRAP
jgi:hypothetical protein